VQRCQPADARLFRLDASQLQHDHVHTV
jgi:hypothetical protein